MTATNVVNDGSGSGLDSYSHSPSKSRTNEPVIADHEVGLSEKPYRPTRWQSNLTILSCYIANFSDGIQNGLANPTNVIFKHLLATDPSGTGYPSTMQTRISNSLIIGAILGVVVLGYVSDMVSRRAGLLFTSGLVTIATLMAALALDVHPSYNMLWFMVVVRGVAGVGVGGEYPPSAAAGLEESDDFKRRYRGPVFVFFTTLMATTAAPIMQIIYLITLKASDNNLPVTFHALYSIATILPFMIMLLRFFMVDSTLYHNSNFKTTRQSRSFKFYLLLIRRYWPRLLSTSAAFFLYDFINFPNSIMSSTIIASLSSSRPSPVPGVILGAYLTNAIGRKYTGILGFAGYVVTGFIIGGLFTPLSNHIAAFVVLYGLLNAFGHMGPGATIGLISTESFPTAIRGMGYSVALAFGRTGAAVGTHATFYLAGSVAVLGIVVYWFLPESGELDLEKEDRELEAYLRENGVVME
ncbi:major facilitator superfamily domain-containing protein [Aspergillus undulatus]|uniref:major facilitator superfamily domain-containing protein n=1 Tax=Aspergillus undulatus TaxID=1810928 RepID=UPI003CCD3DAF